MPVLVRLLAAASLLVAGSPAWAGQDPVYTGTFSDLAVEGHDPVAYFRQGRPVEGDRRWSLEWQGATWRFASPENLEAFKADPEAFAPRYGGYCAWAVSQGYTASADPEAWRIVDGKLYLNYDQDVQKTWEQEIPGNIGKADANWPRVLEEGRRP